MNYRNTDIYKAVMNSEEKKRLIRSVDDLINSNNFSEDLIGTIHKIGKALISGPMSVKVMAFAALAYLVMPFDLVPDFIPIAGFADDALVLGMILDRIASSLRIN